MFRCVKILDLYVEYKKTVKRRLLSYARYGGDVEFNTFYQIRMVDNLFTSPDFFTPNHPTKEQGLTEYRLRLSNPFMILLEFTGM